MNEKLEVVKWTFWQDKRYKERILDPEHLEAILENMRQHGYRLNGYHHQQYEYGVPVFNDGTKYNVSMRTWGDVMAKLLGIEGEMSYLTWAWTVPEDSNPVLPRPEEWGEKEESEQLRLYDEAMRECLSGESDF